MVPTNHNPMIIIPAIDLKEGRCVRLRQGKMDSSTIFNENPAEQARLWQDSGASRIHVVDLDGSVGGSPANLASIRDIVRAVGAPVQLGGGIRDEETIRMYLDLGVSTVILGTIAVKSPDAVLGFLQRFPGKIAVGIDARDGMVAVEGWTETSSVSATDVAAKFDPARPFYFIYTDIERDGMMKGPNIPATRAFARATDTPVILSGGVSSLDDVRNALPLESDGVAGVIIGRALYEGTINVQDAIGLAEE